MTQLTLDAEALYKDLLAGVRGLLQRLGPEGDPAEFTRLNSELMELEARRRALRADD